MMIDEISSSVFLLVLLLMLRFQLILTRLQRLRNTGESLKLTDYVRFYYSFFELAK